MKHRSNCVSKRKCQDRGNDIVGTACFQWHSSKQKSPDSACLLLAVLLKQDGSHLDLLMKPTISLLPHASVQNSDTQKQELGHVQHNIKKIHISNSSCLATEALLNPPRIGRSFPEINNRAVDIPKGYGFSVFRSQPQPRHEKETSEGLTNRSFLTT